MITNRILLFASLIFAAGTSARAQDAPSWMNPTLDETGTYWIAEPLATAMTGISEIEIPASITKDGRTLHVKEIKGFGSYTDITKVTIKGTDVVIDDGAFSGCTGLAEVVFEGSVTSIGASAFAGCTALTEFSIPKSVTEIGSMCFKECTALKSVRFEGGGLTTIPQQMFLSCTSIEELEIPDGVTTIKAWAFSGCTSLKTLTLPKTVTIIRSNVLQNCSAFETLKLYAAASTTTLTSSSFSNTSSKNALTLLVPNNQVPAYQADSNWNTIFTGGIKGIFAFTPEIGPGGKYIISASDSEAVLDVFRALSNPNGAFANANVNLTNDVAFSPVVLDYEALSASNIFTVLDAFPTVGSYAGEFNGANISGLTMRSAGLFGTLEEGSQVNNLVLQDATLYVDPSDTETYEVDGDDVTIHILAKTNNGTVTNFGFSGDIIVDEALATGKEISVCAVNEMGDDAEINGFVHLGELATIGDGNTKRCITIKQNLGVKRPPGKSTKVATNKSASNKYISTIDFDSEEYEQSVCAFTDEEFASGLVAYWLNFTGPGFTGDYTGYWAQGQKVPVPATTSASGEATNSLDLVNYGTTNMRHITSGPTFANVGSQITIEYDVTPSSVTIGGERFTGFGTNKMTVTFDPYKAISLTFPKTQTALDEPAAPEKASYSIAGRTVTVSGVPAGSEVRLTSFTGIVVATSKGQSITAPRAGAYVLSFGGNTQKIVLK